MKFRKKPVVIEAWQWRNAADQGDPPAWLAVPISDGRAYFVQDLERPGHVKALCLPTLEGVMEAKPGDWIIQGVKGEIYPCKPDIFEQTYEAVA